MKYVKTAESIIAFSDGTLHSYFKHLNPISAGFIEWKEGQGWYCFGESISLGLKSLDGDSDLANIQLR